METEEKVWEILMSADKKDYEQICIDYHITNFRGMLTKLNEMKREREEEIAEVCGTPPVFLGFDVNLELDTDRPCFSSV